MATILLSAAGAAIGSSIGGSVLGLSMTAVGRFIGASIGRSLDQRLLGTGSEAVETGKIDRFRLTGAGEGAPIAQVYGRMRVGGHVIWATEFKERVRESGGSGKGAPPQPKIREFSYSVSLALALCEGQITSVNRVWADGAEIAVDDLNMRVYAGTQSQLPDPKIEAVEGTGQVPAYRGTAYVVIEDLRLERFGNRVPQFSFEVTRPDLSTGELPDLVRGVAMIPGTGEYALATDPIYMRHAASAQDNPFGIGAKGKAVANVNSPSEAPDFNTSLKQLGDEAPNCGTASLIVSWFGDDLRCGSCTIRPKVEQTEHEAKSMPWSVAGIDRSLAEIVPQSDGRPVYGGTPTDASVIQAIQKMQAEGLGVMYYPFVLMDQMPGNDLPDPWTGTVEQAPLPWRGRITLSAAPGQPGSPDGTATADAEIAAFFGTASASDFSVTGGAVAYSGPQEWGYRRFILHQAALCAAAGGVEAFCIGSEMRGLTQIRGATGFAAVAALKDLASECRALLGSSTMIGYAADWTEYFGYQPNDGSGDLYFHLDPLWSDAEIDFVGIDNYMPLSDWRNGQEHADAGWGSIYNQDYLRANIEGGEGYDWFYASEADQDAQVRTPISDEAHGEPWVWRYKDLRNWWSNPHHDRIAGVRQPTATAWQSESKPIWFTELGCAAIDKGTNQPNKFFDPKSSESNLPHYSNGLRDDAIQQQYLKAQLGYWGEAGNNPVSSVYGGQMLDLERCFVWAWDARPYPWFPADEKLWSDGPNYRRGHWLNGRLSIRSLASVVREICSRVGLTDLDTSDLHGVVRGYVVSEVSDARRALQPLMLAHGFDAIERDGRLVFRMRRGLGPVDIPRDVLAVSDEIEGDLVETRASEAEMAGRVRVHFVLADADHQVAAEEAVLPDEAMHAVSETDMPLALTRGEGRQTAERWLAEARVSRDTLRFALPPSKLALGAGDIVRLPSDRGPTLARIDKVEIMEHQIVDAVRIEPDVFLPSDMPEEPPQVRPFTPAVPVTPVFLDLPLISGDEVPHAPHLALSATPWPGSVAVYDAAQDADYGLNGIVAARSVIGLTETDLPSARAGVSDNGAPLEVRLASGGLQSISDAALLGGGNLMAIGDGAPGNWELFQFRDAELISEGRWSLSHRLRGQVGSDGVMPTSWPAGSWVVLLDGTPSQIALKSLHRGLERHYRIGPASQTYDHPSYEHRVHVFEGNGLRPYRPVHLNAELANGDLSVRWIRRTRIDGDGWDRAEVPLGEDSEAYQVRVRQGETVLRDVTVNTSEWAYAASEMAVDGASGTITLCVAQVSERYGAGPFAELQVTV
ncbi:Putative phage tail protein [Mameliella alba]|uniref:baseplate multidomain protein megatron n=1 Tax=Mameliella alba TaxID=561184 RepID=UPI000881898B|nr:glycoside hydrolase/phage tail family protein [Mameliella alba]OWV49603.1 host specificity protein [Mameliella alba]PTR41583.1 putative tail protein [Mameliella alba]GGF52733.1 phage host specificity protein [Mameliella alba]SDC37403.1 Putative phage tail protein [Mameliella alba]